MKHIPGFDLLQANVVSLSLLFLIISGIFVCGNQCQSHLLDYSVTDYSDRAETV